MNEWIIPAVAAAFTSYGFSLLFHINGYKIFIVSLGGALDWLIYLLSMNMNDNRILSFFIATAVSALFAEIVARLIKAPVITLIAPMLIPLVPGSDLYYSTFALVRGHMEDFSSYGTQLIFEVGAMSLGLIVIACFMQIYTRILTILKQKQA
ncbi:MAG: threonine/serine exporter family protein [Eubacteriales bacterium]|nr:threonine/serine exporter family protein [Eubacteriales bacterium]